MAGIVLAAGDSQRMGTPKAAIDLDGSSFVARVLSALADGGAEPLLIVVGKDADTVRGALPRGREVALLRNPEPGRGQLSSLKVALAELLANDATVAGAVVALVDHPVVTPATIAALVSALQRSRADGAPAIALPRHLGKRGHPVGFSRAVWDELLATPDELGARAVTRRVPGRVQEIDVDDPGVLLDIDTPDDLQRLRAGTS